MKGWEINSIVQRISFLEHQLKKITMQLREKDSKYMPDDEDLKEGKVTEELAKVAIKVLRGDI